METQQEKRKEVLKKLEMVGQGKIDQDKALTMIAMLEGKDVIGGPNGVVKGRESGIRRLLYRGYGVMDDRTYLHCQVVAVAQTMSASVAPPFVGCP